MDICDCWQLFYLGFNSVNNRCPQSYKQKMVSEKILTCFKLHYLPLILEFSAT